MNATNIDLCLMPNESAYGLSVRVLASCVDAERANHASVILHNGAYLHETGALYRNTQTQATQELNLDTFRESIVDMCTTAKGYTSTCTHPTFEGLMTVGHGYTPTIGGVAQATEIRYAVAHRMSTQVGKVRAVFFPNVKSADKDTRNANWNQFIVWARETIGGDWHVGLNKERAMYIGSQNVKAVMSFVKPEPAAAPVPMDAPITAVSLPSPVLPAVIATPVAAPAPAPAPAINAELQAMMIAAGLMPATTTVVAPVLPAPVEVSDKASLVAQVVAAGHMSRSLADRTSIDTLRILANSQ